MTLRNYIQFSQKKGKKRGSWAYGCFLPKSRYHSIYFKKYSNFKSKFSFNNGNIFEDDYDYYMIILELGKMSHLMICLN